MGLFATEFDKFFERKNRKGLIGQTGFQNELK